jgi:hypothetical protein
MDAAELRAWRTDRRRLESCESDAPQPVVLTAAAVGEKKLVREGVMARAGSDTRIVSLCTHALAL